VARLWQRDRGPRERPRAIFSSSERQAAGRAPKPPLATQAAARRQLARLQERVQPAPSKAADETDGIVLRHRDWRRHGVPPAVTRTVPKCTDRVGRTPEQLHLVRRGPPCGCDTGFASPRVLPNDLENLVHRHPVEISAEDPKHAFGVIVGCGGFA